MLKTNVKYNFNSFFSPKSDEIDKNLIAYEIYKVQISNHLKETNVRDYISSLSTDFSKEFFYNFTLNFNNVIILTKNPSTFKFKFYYYKKGPLFRFYWKRSSLLKTRFTAWNSFLTINQQLIFKNICFPEYWPFTQKKNNSILLNSIFRNLSKKLAISRRVEYSKIFTSSWSPFKKRKKRLYKRWFGKIKVRKYKNFLSPLVFRRKLVYNQLIFIKSYISIKSLSVCKLITRYHQRYFIGGINLFYLFTYSLLTPFLLPSFLTKNLADILFCKRGFRHISFTFSTTNSLRLKSKTNSELFFSFDYTSLCHVSRKLQSTLNSILNSGYDSMLGTGIIECVNSSLFNAVCVYTEEEPNVLYFGYGVKENESFNYLSTPSNKDSFFARFGPLPLDCYNVLYLLDNKGATINFESPNVLIPDKYSVMGNNMLFISDRIMVKQSIDVLAYYNDFIFDVNLEHVDHEIETLFCYSTRDVRVCYWELEARRKPLAEYDFFSYPSDDGYTFEEIYRPYSYVHVPRKKIFYTVQSNYSDKCSIIENSLNNQLLPSYIFANLKYFFFKFRKISFLLKLNGSYRQNRRLKKIVDKFIDFNYSVSKQPRLPDLRNTKSYSFQLVKHQQVLFSIGKTPLTFLFKCFYFFFTRHLIFSISPLAPLKSQFFISNKYSFHLFSRKPFPYFYIYKNSSYFKYAKLFKYRKRYPRIRKFTSRIKRSFLSRIVYHILRVKPHKQLRMVKSVNSFIFKKDVIFFTKRLFKLKLRRKARRRWKRGYFSFYRRSTTKKILSRIKGKKVISKFIRIFKKIKKIKIFNRLILLKTRRKGVKRLRNYMFFNFFANLFRYFVSENRIPLTNYIFLSKSIINKSLFKFSFKRLFGYFSIYNLVNKYLSKQKSFKNVRDTFYWLNLNNKVKFRGYYNAKITISGASNLFRKTPKAYSWLYPRRGKLMFNSNSEFNIPGTSFKHLSQNKIRRFLPKKKYFLNMNSVKLKTYRSARIIHWNYFNKGKTLRERRYKLFLWSFMRKEVNIFSHYFYALNLHWKLPWAFWKYLSKFIQNFHNIKKINLYGIYCIPLNYSFFKRLSRVSYKQNIFKFRIRRWLRGKSARRTRFWMTPRKNLPKVLWQAIPEYRKFRYFVHYDRAINTFMVLKDDFRQFNFKGVLRLMDNHTMKLLNYRYKA